MMIATMQQAVNPAVLMQFPQTVDVAEAVRIALCQRGRGPFIGIPCGNRKTVLIRRELFMKSLAGLRIVDAALVWSACGHDLLGLRVSACGPRVKATRLFYHQDARAYDNRKLIETWKNNEARRLETKALVSGLDKKQAAKARKIATLYKKLERLTRRPKNPATASGYHRQDSPFGGDMHPNIARWYTQKPVRRTCKSKEDLSKCWYEHQHEYGILTGKPWELAYYYGRESLEWAAGRYDGLRDPERVAVKAQLAVLLEIPENQVSVFRKRG